MDAVEFLGNGDDDLEDCRHGVYHLVGAPSQSDYTLCGATMDGDTFTVGAFRIVKVKAINCPTCSSIINHCRNKRIAD